MTLHCVHGDNVEMQTLDLNFLSEDLFFKDPPPPQSFVNIFCDIFQMVAVALSVTKVEI